MLSVGLTGGLGSGKSTVARMFSQLGAAIVSADEIGRRLMQPGEPVYAAIVEEFGFSVVNGDGSLNRKALAELVFQGNQGEALNRIVHPATVAAEKLWMQDVFRRDPLAIAVVESALIFEVEKWGTAPGWLQCFDRLILVSVPDELKIERFMTRAMVVSGDGEKRREELERDARARLARQIPDPEKARLCDYIIDNSGPLEKTCAAVERIYQALRRESEARAQKAGSHT